MSRVVYTIVEHDGGWAYQLGDVYSETYPSHETAYRAARDAAVEQQVDAVEIRSARRQDSSADSLPGGTPKVDLTRDADAIVDGNFDAPQSDAIDERQEEIAERKADERSGGTNSNARR
jgi:hypothetical protein